MNRNLPTIIINTLLIATATLTVIPLLGMISAFMPAMVHRFLLSLARGDGRSIPPLSYDEFVRRMQTWAAKGAGCLE